MILGTAVLALFAAITGLEAGLAWRGFRPSLLDTESLWLEKRAEADSVGNHGLILVGDSRTELDLDQDVLRRKTGLEPVQLAIDGDYFLPVFRGIAADPHITGTVLVGFAPAALLDADNFAASSNFETEAERNAQKFDLPDFNSMDRRLTDALHGRLRSYADGSQPLVSLTRRLLNSEATPQYLTTLPDRSTLADYSLVPMPNYYYRRVYRNLGEPQDAVSGLSRETIEAHIKAKIATLKPLDDSYFRQRIADIAAMTAAIEARGGRVIFIAYPETGYVRQIDTKLFPRNKFWDLFAAGVGTQTLYYADIPALASFACPDGSHLDFRERAAFTSALVDVLHLGGQGPKRGP